MDLRLRGGGGAEAAVCAVGGGEVVYLGEGGGEHGAEDELADYVAGEVACEVFYFPFFDDDFDGAGSWGLARSSSRGRGDVDAGVDFDEVYAGVVISLHACGFWYVFFGGADGAHAVRVYYGEAA